MFIPVKKMSFNPISFSLRKKKIVKRGFSYTENRRGLEECTGLAEPTAKSGYSTVHCLDETESRFLRHDWKQKDQESCNPRFRGNG